MRNLKRVLSLSLASVMLLGMMVIGSSAAQDYTDVDYDNDNVEAIEVLDAINVMRGDLDANGELAGTFRPGGDVKRSEMARIMAALMDLDYDYYVGANPFNDMVGHWAEGYAAACYANGIIAGRTNTTYDPDATVTAVEAAAMLMRALGYFQNRDVDYADGFEISTVRQAGRINLFNNLDVKTNEPMTRNDVAQLVLNALQSGMVEPSTNLSVTTPDGFTVSTGATNYVYRVARNDDIGKAINETKAFSGNATDGLNGYVLDLGEQLYQGSLKLDDDIDVFGRPARRWEFDGTKVGTYVKWEQFRKDFTGKVTGRDLNEVLTSSTIDKYIPTITIDGETSRTYLDAVTNSPYFTAGNLIRANTEAVGETDKGVLTQVFVDTLNERYYIAIINTYLAKATQDYSTRDEDVDFDVYAIRNTGSRTELHMVKDTEDDPNNSNKPYVYNMTVKNEDIEVSDVKKDDIFLAHVADGEIQELIVPEIIDSTVLNSFKKGSWVNNGSQYNYADTARYDDEVLDEYDDANMKNLTYNIILDEYGYLIGLELNEDPDQYVFITGIESGSSNIGNRNADMNAIFLDGTMAVINVDMIESAKKNQLINNFNEMGPIVNTWCKYSVSSSDVYTLSVIPTTVGSGKVAQWAQNVANGVTGNPANPGPAHRDNDYDAATSGGDGISINNGTTSQGTNPYPSYTIDKGHISLLGNPNDTTSYARVYGTDETVYINAKLGVIRNASINMEHHASSLTGTDITTNDQNSTYWEQGNGLTNGIGNKTDTSNAYANDWNFINKHNAGSEDNIVAIIEDVDTVTVGVRNVDTKVYDIQITTAANTNGYVRNQSFVERADSYIGKNIVYPKSEIYTLYNKDGYVIAAVTLGEEQGTSTKLAYFHTGDLEKEAYPNNDTARAEGEDWYWTRKAIVDGEEVELVEVGSTLTMLGNAWDEGYIHKGDWAEVRFDANGNVRKVTEIHNGDLYTALSGKGAGSSDLYNTNAKTGSFSFKPAGATQTGEYIYDPQAMEVSAKDNRTVLLQTSLFDNSFNGSADPSSSIEYKAGSLWISNAQLEGVGLAPNLKTIVYTSKLRTSDAIGRPTLGNTHNKVDYFDGPDGLAKALKSLDANFHGVLNVLVEDQMATVIILNDMAGFSINQGSSNTPATEFKAKEAKAEEIQDLLDSGIKYIKVIGSWDPDEDLDISDGAIVEITGDVDLTENGVTVSSTEGGGKLKVGGTLTAETGNFPSSKITVDIDAGSMELDVSKKNLEVGSGVRVDVDGDLDIVSNRDRTFTVNGTVVIGGDLYLNDVAQGNQNPSGVITIDVTSPESLHVAGVVAGKAKINVGSVTKEGYIDFETVDSETIEIKIIKIATTGVTDPDTGKDTGIPRIGTVVAGKVETSGTGAKVIIEVAEKDAELVADESNSIIVTEEMNTNNVTGTVDSSDATLGDDALIDGEMDFVFDKDTYLAWAGIINGRAGSNVMAATWEDFLKEWNGATDPNARGSWTTLPYVYVGVSGVSGADVSKIEVDSFTVGGKSVSMLKGDGSPYDDECTSSSKNPWAYFHWEMLLNEDGSTDTMCLSQTRVATNVEYAVTFKVTYGADSKVGYATVSKKYTGPASYTLTTADRDIIDAPSED